MTTYIFSFTIILCPRDLQQELRRAKIEANYSIHAHRLLLSLSIVAQHEEQPRSVALGLRAWGDVRAGMRHGLKLYRLC